MSISQKIFNIGEDTFKNLFVVYFDGLDVIDNSFSNSYSARVQNINVPASGSETYEVHYMGTKITKPSGKITSDNALTFELRVDKYWDLYKIFIKWRDSIANTTEGKLGLDNLKSTSENSRIDIRVKPVYLEKQSVKDVGYWVFKKCFLQSIGEVGFDYSSGDPMTISVTIHYAEMDDSKLSGGEKQIVVNENLETFGVS